MKKILPIFLAFQILATSSPTNQGMQTLLKMGTFFHHFIHHVVCDQEKLGIGGYLELHYSDHEHHEADHHEHENLPFSHHHEHQSLNLQTLWLFAQHHEIPAFHHQIPTTTPLKFQMEHWHSSSYLNDIWQPPKA